MESYCVQETVVIEAFGKSAEVQKNDFAYLIILTDFIMILMYAKFISWLEKC